MMSTMPLNRQTIHALLELNFLHNTSEFFGDSGNIKNILEARSIRNSL